MDLQSASTDLSAAGETSLLGPEFDCKGGSSLASLPNSDDCLQSDKLLRMHRVSGNCRSKIGVLCRLPFFLIAFLLSVTAMAKVWTLLTDPFADIRAGISKEILWVTVAFELWLAVENWLIRDHRVLALVDTIAFTAFAIFAGTRWALGYVSCGCAGSLELPSWLFLIVDSSIVAWFMTTVGQRSILRDGSRELTVWWNTGSPAAKGRLTGLGLFAGFLGFLQLPIAVPLRAAVLGEPPILAIVRLDGDLQLGKENIGHVEIWNRSDQSAKVIGMERSCRCFSFTDDPIGQIIPVQQSISLPLIVKPNKVGPLHQRIVLFLEHPIQFRMNIDVLGSVKGVD